MEIRGPLCLPVSRSSDIRKRVRRSSVRFCAETAPSFERAECRAKTPFAVIVSPILHACASLIDCPTTGTGSQIRVSEARQNSARCVFAAANRRRNVVKICWKVALAGGIVFAVFVGFGGTASAQYGYSGCQRESFAERYSRLLSMDGTNRIRSKSLRHRYRRCFRAIPGY
jgi:hypothetical protein